MHVVQQVKGSKNTRGVEALSHVATNWAWSQTLDPSIKLVLMAICDCHNASNGQCNPSYDYIADKACVSPRTAMRAVKELTENGYISLLKSKGADGLQRSNTYVLNMEETECHGVTRNINRVTNTAEPCDTVVTRNEPEEPELKNKQKENSLFDQFWTSYPDKTAKAYAQKQFNKLSPQDQQAVVASMPAFLKALADKRKTFPSYSPPNPSTYLNQRRFDDFTSSPTDWQKVMSVARRLGGWDFKSWGPAPFAAGCRVPAEYLKPEDNREWKQWMAVA